MIAVAESEWILKLQQTYLSYFSLTGELWGVYFEDFGENELRYNVTALYIHIFFKSSDGYTQQKIAF